LDLPSKSVDRFPTTPDAQKALTLEGEFGLDALKKSNLSKFNVVVPPGVDPTVMAEGIVKNGVPAVEPKVEPNKYNDAVRRYYETGESPWMAQMIPGQGLDTSIIPGSYDKDGNLTGPSIKSPLGPEPPGGYDKQGKPLDENGKRYVVPSMSGEIGKAVSTLSRHIYTKATAVADVIGTQVGNISDDLFKAYDNLTKTNPNMANAIKGNAIALETIAATGSGLVNALVHPLTKHTQVALGKSEEEATAFANKAASETTYQPITEEGKILTESVTKVLGIPFELAGKYIAKPARKLFEETVGDIIKGYGGRPDIAGSLIEDMLTFYFGAKAIGKGPEIVKVATDAIGAKRVEGSLGYTPSVVPPKTPYTGTDFKPIIPPPVTGGEVKTGIAPEDFLSLPEIKPADTKPIEVKSEVIPEVVKDPLQAMVEKAQAKIDEVVKTQADLEAAKTAVAETPVEDVIAEELKVKGEKIQEIRDGVTDQTDQKLMDLVDEDKLDISALEEAFPEGKVDALKINETKPEIVKEPKYATPEQVKDSRVTDQAIDIVADKVPDDMLNGVVDRIYKAYEREDMLLEVDPDGTMFNNLDNAGKRKIIKDFSDANGEDFTLMQRVFSDLLPNKKQKRIGNKKKREPITELDEQLGTPGPELLQPSNPKHPFRDSNVEYTNTMSKMFKEKLQGAGRSIEVYTRYAINEVNRYLNGEDVNIEKVREVLSDLSSKAEEARNQFDRTDDFVAWQRNVGEAAKWARGTNRVSSPQNGTKFMMGVDPTDIVKVVNYMKQKLIKSFSSDKTLNTSGYIFDDGRTSNLTRKIKGGYESIPHEAALVDKLNDFDRDVISSILSGEVKDFILDDYLKQSGTVRYVREENNHISIQLGKRPTEKQMQIIEDSLPLNSRITVDSPVGQQTIDSEIFRIFINSQFNQLDQLKINGSGGTQLNMMIPVDQIPEMVKDVLKGIKAAVKPFSSGGNAVEIFKDYQNSLYRNKEVFDKTGYWLGKDGKWRYEIKDERVHNETYLNSTGESNSVNHRLYLDIDEVVHSPELYKAVPEAKQIKIRVNKDLNAEGTYYSDRKTIEIRKFNEDTIIHELQHAVNDIVGSKFKGTNPKAQERVKIYETLSEMRDKAKNASVQLDIDNALEQLNKGKKETIYSITKDIEMNAFGTGDYQTIIDLIHKHFEDTGTDRYMKNPGEMEARLASKRMEMSAEQRKKTPPWETLDKMLADEGFISPIDWEDGKPYFPTRGTVGHNLYMGIDPTRIKQMFKGFHGTSSKYIKPEDMVGKYLEPKSLKRIVEDTLDELKLFGDERKKAKEKIYAEDYFDMSRDPKKYDLEGSGTRPFDKQGEVYTAKDFEDAADYANWAGEAYDNALLALADDSPLGKRANDIYEKNRSATPYVLEVAFDKPLKEGDNISNNPVKVTGVFDQKGTRLFSGVDPTQIPEATRRIIEGAKKLAAYTNQARGMKEWKPAAAAKMLREEFNRSFIDRSGNIRQRLLSELGDQGYEIVQKMYLSKGASSLAAQQLKQMRGEVYDGLKGNERRVLDNLILADRMLDISKYKTAKEFKFPEGLSPIEAAAYNELFQFTEKLTGEQASLLRDRAKAYFDWMKKPLKDMLDAELISEQEFNDLSSHNYRRIKLVDVFDKRSVSKTGKTKRTVYDSGVEALSRGRDTDIFEPSSEVMALEVFNRAYGRILNNGANRTLLDLARQDRTNPFVRVKETPKDGIPTGWDRVFVYEKGERKALYLSPEMSKEWITNSPEMSYKMSQFLRYASGSPVLRTFATGINWGFALANLPRDIMHIWYAARTFQDGKWNPVYSSNIPVYGLQIGHDIGSVFSDAVLRKGRYQDYIKEGGGMEFLVHQGRLMQRGRHIEGGLDKVMDFLGYFGETSEIMIRLAIRERVLRNGKSSQEATFVARDYMDFGQGGGLGKALDNAFPYLNASIQGTRGLFRAFKDNPLQSTYKTAQFAALVTGLYIYNNNRNPETMKSLKGNIDMQNNLVIPLGDGFSYLDEKGQTRYPFIKIPLDPGQRFFKTMFEASTDKWLGNQIDVDAVTNTLSQISPVGISSLPPTVSGALGYMYNKDFWKNEDIWKKTDKPFSWPQSKQEFIPGQTPQAMVDLGSATGLSPERTKHAIEQLITSGSEWAWLSGYGYDKVFSNLPKSQKEQHLAEVLTKVPGVRRFIGVTNPYSQFASPVEQAREDSSLQRWTENRGLDALVDGYLYQKNTKREEINSYIKGFKDPDTQDRLLSRFEFSQSIKELSNRSFWLALKGTPDTEARARLYVERLNGSTPVQQQALRKELTIVDAAGGVVSDSFLDEVARLRNKTH
jgi:hypothetical protein